jgi:acetylornithine deacetylase/succinyl-diaminopimelate desuccinylase-like protein
MKSYSPRLQVRFDKWHIKKNGQRIFKDIDLYNVVAVLPGKTMPETQVIVSGHYDSLNLGAQRPGAAAAGPGSDAPPAAIGERPTQSNWEANAELPAPGACDDGSGTAATMELTRVMSQYEFDKTLVFIAFAGEEQGLVGSTLESKLLRPRKTRPKLKPFSIMTSSEPTSAAMAAVTAAVSPSTVTQSWILPRRISPATPS